MSATEQWPNTEKRLLQEADSLGTLLERLRGYVSPVLIGDQEWDRVLRRAYELPVTMAAFPFGFEIPLHDARPGADLGVSLVGGSRSAEFFTKKGDSKDTDPSTSGIAWLLREMQPEDSPLHRVVGQKMLLEYDVDQIPTGMPSFPGIFLYPAKRTLVGDGSERNLQGLRTVTDAVAFATGWQLNEAERQQIDRVYLGMKPSMDVRAIGAFPSRGRAIRLTATEFRKAEDAVGFLERVNWPGQHATVAAVMSRFDERDAFAYAGVHYDVTENGVGPKLGLSFFAKEGQWLKDIRHWTPLIDGMREERLAVSDKLSELVAWSGSESFSGKDGSFVFVRGIHHIKLALVDDRIEQVKAYVFFLIFAWPLTG